MNNLFAELPEPAAGEVVDAVASLGSVRIERIVSAPGTASPDGLWYDQDWAEWVLLLAGSAALLFEGEPEPQGLEVGDHVLIPPRRRHRVAWTDPHEPTIWLAVHVLSEM